MTEAAAPDPNTGEGADRQYLQGYLAWLRNEKRYSELTAENYARDLRHLFVLAGEKPLADLEVETVGWCREMLQLSPFALRLVKASFNAHEDGYAGIQQLAHDANPLFYGNEEAKEGREAYKEKRRPDFSKFPRRP